MQSTATTLYETIMDAYDEYMTHLNAGGKKPRVFTPRHHPNKSLDIINASELGRCPLATAKEKRGDPMVVPPTRYSKISLKHLLLQGTRDAEPLQEALLWKWGRARVTKNVLIGEGVALEARVGDKELGTKGRADAVLNWNGETHVVEIKRRDAQRGTSTPMPKDSDVYQVLSYAHIMDLPYKHIHILILNRYFFKLWTLGWDPNQMVYALTDEDGVVWYSGLGLDSFEEAINVHRKYRAEKLTTPPMIDMFAADFGWYCYRWVDGEKPKKYKALYKGQEERIGFIEARCPYWCWGGNPKEHIPVRELEYDSKKYALV